MIRIVFAIRIVLNMRRDIIKPTLLDYAILGLIQDQPLSGYAIRKLFEETELGHYSSSPGTIYPALNRLQKLKLVEKSKQKETTKTRFEITQAGVLSLKKWFLQPIEKKEMLKEKLMSFCFDLRLWKSSWIKTRK